MYFVFILVFYAFALKVGYFLVGIVGILFISSFENFCSKKHYSK